MLVGKYDGIPYLMVLMSKKNYMNYYDDCYSYDYSKLSFRYCEQLSNSTISNHLQGFIGDCCPFVRYCQN
jgi:hypothetical protein